MTFQRQLIDNVLTSVKIENHQLYLIKNPFCEPLSKMPIFHTLLNYFHQNKTAHYYRQKTKMKIKNNDQSLLKRVLSFEMSTFVLPHSNNANIPTRWKLSARQKTTGLSVWGRTWPCVGTHDKMLKRHLRSWSEVTRAFVSGFSRSERRPPERSAPVLLYLLVECSLRADLSKVTFGPGGICASQLQRNTILINFLLDNVTGVRHTTLRGRPDDRSDLHYRWPTRELNLHLRARHDGQLDLNVQHVWVCDDATVWSMYVCINQTARDFQGSHIKNIKCNIF